MKKYFVIGLIAVSLVLGSTFTLAIQGGFNITLIKAQERAQENDLQPILDQLNIEDKVDALETAQEDAKEIDFIAGLPETRLKDKFTKYVYPLQAEMNLELAKMQEVEHQGQLKIDVEKAYQSFWLIEKELATEQKSLEVAEVEYQAQKTRFQNDQITATALAASQYSLENQQLRVRELEYKLRKAQYELNQLMGRPLEEFIEIDDTVTLMISDSLDLDLDKLYQQALINNTDIYQKKINAELADLKWQYTAEEYKDTSDTYQDAWYDRELARIELEEAKGSMWLSINHEYHQLMNNLDSYALQEKAVKLKQKEYQIACAEYESGKISKITLLQSEHKLLEAQYTLNSNMISLNSDWQSFCQQYAGNQ